MLHTPNKFDYQRVNTFSWDTSLFQAFAELRRSPKNGEIVNMGGGRRWKAFVKCNTVCEYSFPSIVGKQFIALYFSIKQKASTIK